jgi:ribosomal protein S12 methylthiotransferase accessory factor
MVCRPNSRSLAVSQGKGRTLALAKTSGVMESIEGYHAERVIQPLLLRRYADLRLSRTVVDVGALPLVEGSVFHADRDLLWIEGHDLMHDTPIWLPYELVHLDFTMPQPAGSGCFNATSNGLASGNHVLEAISHAICEVVERDAIALWSQQDETACRSARVDLATVDDTGCLEVLSRFEQAGIFAAVFDITSDVGIPCFFCTIGENITTPFRPLYFASGSGCHPNRGIALLRALTEAAQSRLTAIAGSRDDLARGSYLHTGDPEVQAAERGFLTLPEDAVLRDYTRAPTFDADTFDADVAWELEHLRSAEIDRVVVVDLSRPEFGIPVVRVVIPGLEGMSERHGYVPGARAMARRRPV